MAVSPKTPLPPDVFVSLTMGGVDWDAATALTRPAPLDFIPNPAHYRVSGKSGRATPKRAAERDLARQLVRELTLECEASQLLDSDYNE